MKFFNTTGPCNPDEHYMLQPTERLVNAQRTAENGQQITQEALDYVYEQSRGQPWIVNSLFKRVTLQIMDEQSVETAELKHFIEAREKMIMARETHLDALAYRLKEPGIRGVIEPILTGESDPDLAEGEAFRLCQDLGLVAIERGTPRIANPIYREMIARHLTYGQQLAIPEPNWQWEKPDGSLNMDKMMQEFQKFWRRHSERWEEKADYTEAFPHRNQITPRPRWRSNSQGRRIGANQRIPRQIAPLPWGEGWGGACPLLFSDFRPSFPNEEKNLGRTNYLGTRRRGERFGVLIS